MAPTVAEQLELRDRLQRIEDELIRAKRRRVIVRTKQGDFVWRAPVAEADNADLEALDLPALQAIEDALIVQSWDDLIAATTRGSFAWMPGTKKPPTRRER